MNFCRSDCRNQPLKRKRKQFFRVIVQNKGNTIDMSAMNDDPTKIDIMRDDVVMAHITAAFINLHTDQT